MGETTKAKKRKKNRNYKIILLSILIIILALLCTNYYKQGFTAISEKDVKEINVEIPNGSSTKKISSILKEEGLIRNEIIFQIATKNNEADGKLKAGTYLLNTGMDIDDIIAQLIKGVKNEEVTGFTIPEGYEVREIADKLAAEGLIDKERFLNLTGDKKNFEEEYPLLKQLEDGQDLEGFLYPSTYEIYIGSTEEDIIKKMLNEFEKVYEKNIKEDMSNIDLSLNEIVTLASMVEKEARVDKERAIMAGVLYNRLESDMLLQIDATVQYALGERKERLLYKDLEVESPYNTYLYKGLPPGPISSPGENSIIATMNPSDVDYFFYVLKKDGSGEHIFNITYDEHIKSQKE